MIPKDSPPVPFTSQCRILVPTTGRYNSFQTKTNNSVNSFAAESHVDLSVQKQHSH